MRWVGRTVHPGASDIFFFFSPVGFRTTPPSKRIAIVPQTSMLAAVRSSTPVECCVCRNHRLPNNGRRHVRTYSLVSRERIVTWPACTACLLCNRGRCSGGGGRGLQHAGRGGVLRLGRHIMVHKVRRKGGVGGKTATAQLFAVR